MKLKHFALSIIAALLQLICAMELPLLMYMLLN